MRLIDADALVKCVNKIFGLKPDARWSHGAVLNTIDAAPTISEWIRVEDRLPDSAFGCLVTVWDNNAYGDCFLNLLPYFVGWDGEQWNDYDGEECPFEVYAWMPLPQLPKEVNQDETD